MKEVKKCKFCKFWDPLGKDFCGSLWYENAGECNNPKVYDYVNNGNTLVRAGGSEGDGDYFHTSGEFGCIKFERKTKC